MWHFQSNYLGCRNLSKVTDDRIVTDGGESTPEPPKNVAPWAWLIVGLGLGVGVTFLVAGSALRGPTPGTEVTSTTTADPQPGVGEVVLGFPDNLSIVVSPGAGRALEVVTWPVQGVPTFRSVALSDINTVGTPRFDSSGHFLAAMVDTGDGLLLAAGRPNSFDIVASGVTGFAWHDSDPADLAWSKSDDGEFQLWLSADAASEQLVTRGVGISGELVAFGEWGYAVVEQSGISDGFPSYRTHLIDSLGELGRTIDGRVIGSYRDGLLAVEREGEAFLIDGLAETRLDTGGLEGGVAIGAAFSPAGDKLALTGLIGVAVVDLGGESRAEIYSLRAGSDSIAWSSDGRFILVSSFRGVAVLNYGSGEITVVLEDQTTRAVAVAPITSP